MSWFTDIATKAESMLEKLDKNAATVLNTEALQQAATKAMTFEQPAEDEPLPDGALFAPPQQNSTAAAKKGTTLAQLRSSKSSSSLKAMRKKKQDKDEEMISYLNGSAPSLDHSTINIPDSVEGDPTSVRTENSFLKSEIESLNLEIARLLQKFKKHEKDQQELISRQAKITELELSLQQSRTEAQQLNKELKELQALKSESHFELSTEIERLTKMAKDHEATTTTLSVENARLSTELSGIHQELGTLRENFEKYRTRAQSVLSEKDSLITRLKNHQTVEDEKQIDNALENEEIKLLRQGNEEMSNQLSAVRAELSSRDDEKSQLARALNEVQASLDISRQTVASADHELIFFKEELERQRSEVVRVTHECDRLKAAQAAKPPSRPQPEITSDYMADLDTKVRSLTATLVKKQQAVEILTAERNAMRLQLEKTELKLRESTHVYNTGIIACDMNTTDDAKAGIMSGFLRERIVESGMSRRVRRAYSTLDSVTGSLMRRHPLAKLCLIAYLLLIHIWVLGILFTYTPDSHNKHNTPM